MKKALALVCVLAFPVVSHAQSHAVSLQDTIDFLNFQIASLQAKVLGLESELLSIGTTPPPPPSGTTVTVTFYPTLDARIHCSSSQYWGTNGTWSGVRNASRCGPYYLIESSEGDHYHQMYGSGVVPISSVTTENNGSGYYHLYRFFMEFDTSSIPSNAVIQSARVFITGYSGADNSDGTSLGLYVSTQSQLGTLQPIDFNVTPSSYFDWTTTDYSQCGTSAIASGISLANWANGANAFEFGPTGKALLPASRVNVCMRTTMDAANIAPGGMNQAYFYTMEVGEAAKKPQLVVTYTY